METINNITVKRYTGFAILSPERRRELGRLGGQAAQKAGKGRPFTSETGRVAAKSKSSQKTTAS